MKRWLANEAVRRALTWLAAQYIRLVFRTSRWRTLGGEHPRAFWDSGRPFVGCFWHGRILMMPESWDYRAPINMLISAHADGRLISRTVAHFGIKTIAGSTTAGGTAALRAIVRALQAGECVAVTPDGPRGPRMRVAAGLVLAAKLAGAPILPVTYSTTRARLAGSWDRFLVALPFGRGVYLWGPPVAVPPDADAAALEAARRAVEDSLNALTAEADRLCGRPPVEPAPA